MYLGTAVRKSMWCGDRKKAYESISRQINLHKEKFVPCRIEMKDG